jgi:hypothetical protein
MNYEVHAKRWPCFAPSKISEQPVLFVRLNAIVDTLILNIKTSDYTKNLVNYYEPGIFRARFSNIVGINESKQRMSYEMKFNSWLLSDSFPTPSIKLCYPSTFPSKRVEIT